MQTGEACVPGLVVIFANQRPALRIIQIGEEPIDLGRVDFREEDRYESTISRHHTRIFFDGKNFRVTDLGSRNGTFIARRAISGEERLAPGSILRIGGVILLAVADTKPFKEHGLGIKDGIVSGPSLRQLLETIALSQGLGMLRSLLVTGESGTGKEIAAQVFHRSGSKPEAPFAALNCATIPKDLAERILFGSRRGAFSGATDAPGHVQAANGGTLFLDEIAELPQDVQSKLLRMLETREVLRLGSTRYEQVDVRVCAATWRDLRAEVASGRFREDLYYRIGQPEIRLPPLRERIEEIPWHLQQGLESCRGERQLSLTAGFVEACAIRPWPGNIRELRGEVRRSAAAVAANGAQLLRAEDLALSAGMLFPREPIVTPQQEFPNDEFAAALTADHGNVAAAARRLGVHRNRVRRWLERHSVDSLHFKR